MRASGLAFAALLLAFPGAAIVAQGTENPHGAKIGACATCHAPNAWKPARITRAFKHAEGRFPLEAAHARTSCVSCHKSLDFSKAPKACGDCHSDVHKGELGVQCARCHTPRSFVDQGQLRRMHELTLLPLRGAHAAITCEACHTPTASGQAQYAGRPAVCMSCHAADYRATKAPDHALSQFSTDCTSCHGNVSWQNATFDHSVTHFALTGAHKAVSCLGCHIDNVYKGKSTACISCHQQNYTASLLPPHSQLNFPSVCSSCHTTTAWQGGSYDHSTTSFPLTGAHQAVSCTGCHADGVYRAKATACAGCHQALYTATTTPPHAASGFSISCESCHGTSTWGGATFNHTNTRFPLTGLHVTTPCASCHADGVYHGKATACASCHQSKYTLTTTPPHAASGFPLTCEACHSTSSWLTATFDHSTSRFPLTGAHQTTPCSSCHADGVYHGKPTACASCHQAKFSATTNPPHASAGFSTNCESCHSTATWAGAQFNHANTKFPLTGLHVTTPCASCHGDGVYAGKPTSCVSCHQAKYTMTSTPPHAAAGFPLSCETCHSTASWLTATFNHATTKFPLTGGHLTVPCSSCHGDGVYVGKPTTCVSCHQPKYAATTSPPHAAAGFPTTCDACHSTASWLTATFNHATTKFPLTGVHATQPCSACHADGVYVGKSTLCYSCHTADYKNTNNPVHSSAGFPTTCEGCHTTSTWLGATFNHDASFFPIYSGKHKGKWAACTDCHTSASNYAQFSCFQCHAQSSTTNNHKGVSGYSYDSNKCYSCHPKGSAG